MRASHLREDRREQEDIGQLWIELRAAAGRKDVGGFARCPAVAVPAAVCDGVEGIRDRDDARGEWNPSPFYSTRISLTIPALVMRKHRFGELLVEVRDGGEDLSAASGMRRDRTALGRGQPSSFVHDVEEGLVDLADIMEKRGKLDGATHGVVDAECVGEDERVTRDAPDVGTRLRVVRVDGS